MRAAFAILLPLFGLFACTARQESDAARRDYDSRTDCLNGTFIVSENGRYGLVDSSGREILPTVYDDVYYLTDEIAAAFSGRNCEFFDRSGRRMAEAEMPATASPREILDIYLLRRDECRLTWDSILDKYSHLREYCKSEGASAAEAELMTEDIREALRTVIGPMEKDQKAAFETLYSDYR